MGKSGSSYQNNIFMVFLCGLSVFWVLISPLVPYGFDTAAPSGLALFVTLQVTCTAVLSAIGVTLNGWAERGVQVTPHTLRAALRRRRR